MDNRLDEIGIAVKCGHCEGTGTCQRGSGQDNSCDSFRIAAGAPTGAVVHF
jgi:hypothetical protein